MYWSQFRIPNSPITIITILWPSLSTFSVIPLLATPCLLHFSNFSYCFFQIFLLLGIAISSSTSTNFWLFHTIIILYHNIILYHILYHNNILYQKIFDWPVLAYMSEWRNPTGSSPYHSPWFSGESAFCFWEGLSNMQIENLPFWLTICILKLNATSNLKIWLSNEKSKKNLESFAHLFISFKFL